VAELMDNYHVICAQCDKSHYGQQIWNDKLKDYVCIKCAAELEEEMRVEITLHDEEGQPTMMVSNCHQDNLINVRLLDGTESTNVNVDDLRSAIRKITAK
jgi:hypothetical protein